MWLIKLHIAFSILILITFWGFMKVFAEQIKANGWLDAERKKKKRGFVLFMFVPLLNILILLVLFMLIFVKKEDWERETAKRNAEESE